MQSSYRNAIRQRRKSSTEDFPHDSNKEPNFGSIAHILAKVQRLYAQVSRFGCAAANPSLAGDPKGRAVRQSYEDRSTKIWARIEMLCRQMAEAPTGAIAEIRFKIAAWRLLAPSSIFDEDEQSSDELLLYSILRDIEAMAEPPADRRRDAPSP